MSDIKIEYYIDAMKEANSFDNFVHLIEKYSNNTDESSHLKDLLTNNNSARSAFDQVRKILGLPSSAILGRENRDSNSNITI